MRGNPFATLVATVAVLVAGASLSGFAWMYAKVRAYERATGTSVFSATGSVARAAAPASAATPASSPATNASESAKATPPAALGHEPEAAVAMKVASVEYDGDSKLKVRFTASPDLDGSMCASNLLTGALRGLRTRLSPKAASSLLPATSRVARTSSFAYGEGFLQQAAERASKRISPIPSAGATFRRASISPRRAAIFLRRGAGRLQSKA